MFQLFVFDKKRLFLALGGLLFAILIHSWNGFQHELPFGIHTTADDASYIRPAENLWEIGIWKDSSIGASSYVQRPPLYGAIHWFFFGLFGKQAGIVMVAFFFLLHGLALYRMPLFFSAFTSEKSAIRFTLLYAILPCFWGFLSYHITEALSPSLVILLMTIVIQNRKHSIAISVLLLTGLFLLRPILILLFPVILIFWWKKRRDFSFRTHKINCIALGLSALTVFAWESRKAYYMDNWLELHPIYHVTNESIYRPIHASLTNVFRVWETKPELFHALVGSCWNGDTSTHTTLELQHYIRQRNAPIKAQQLSSILDEYAAINRELLIQFQQSEIQFELPAERNLRLKLDQIATELASENKFRYWIQTPVQGAVEQLQKSQLNLELFQATYKNTMWVKILKISCVSLILLSLLGLFFQLFSTSYLLKGLAFGVLLYFFYLFFVQRLNEDRYIIPALPVIFCLGMLWWEKITKKVFYKSPKTLKN